MGTVTKTIKWLICIFCWLTLSPLFSIHAKNWNLLSKRLRLTLLMLSPLYLFIYYFVGYNIWWLSVSSEYYFKHKYDCRNRVEKMIELPNKVHIPKYKAIDFQKEKDFIDNKTIYTNTIEFKKLPSELFYSTLDSLSAVKGSKWDKNQKDTVISYHFSTSWPYGYLPGHFSLWIEKGRKKAIINYGTWWSAGYYLSKYYYSTPPLPPN